MFLGDKMKEYKIQNTMQKFKFSSISVSPGFIEFIKYEQSDELRNFRVSISIRYFAQSASA